MSQSIHVDLEKLKEFVDSLERFQEKMHEKHKNIETAWNICDNSWEGKAKQEFEVNFTRMNEDIASALKDVDSSVVWLQEFYKIVEEFEGY